MKLASVVYSIVMCLLICNIDVNKENILFIIASHGIGIVIALLADLQANNLLTRNHFSAFPVSSTQSIVYRVAHLFSRGGYFVFPALYIVGYTINSQIATEQKALYALWTLLQAILLVGCIFVLYDYLLSKNLGKHILNFFALYISFPSILFNLSFINLLPTNNYALANPLHSGVAFVLLFGIDDTIRMILLSLGGFGILSMLLLLFNKRMHERWTH